MGRNVLYVGYIGKIGRGKPAMPSPGKQETVARIKEAFWSLYEQKPFEDITVKQITNLAGYNRGTFYLYFNNIREVLYSIENDVVESIVGPRTTEDMLSFLLVQRPIGEELESFAKIFLEHQRYLIVLFGDNGDPAFARKLKRAIKDRLSPEIQAMTTSTPEAVDIALEYVLSGEIGLLTELFTSPETISRDAIEDALNIIRVVAATIAPQSGSDRNSDGLRQ